MVSLSIYKTNQLGICLMFVLLKCATKSAVSTNASSMSVTFDKYCGMTCGGSEPNILSDYLGTVEECKAKCLELEECIGFVKVSSGQYAGCHFRNGTLDTPSAYTSDIRDCYIPITKYTTNYTINYATNYTSNCSISEFPSCKPNCLMIYPGYECPTNNERWTIPCNQIKGNIYRIDGKCYKALTYCHGCLENIIPVASGCTPTELHIFTPTELQPVSCDQCTSNINGTSTTKNPATNISTDSHTSQCDTNSVMTIPTLTDLKFDEITTEYFMNYTMTVGWIKFVSCKEGDNDMDLFTYYFEDKKFIPSELVDYILVEPTILDQLRVLSSNAISIKFIPPGGKANIHYNNLAVIAKPCSNPIYLLNNGKALSYTVNISSDIIIGPADLNNWIGTDVAKRRLNNRWPLPDIDITQPLDIIKDIYDAAWNAQGIRILPDKGICYWDFNDIFNQNIQVYVGFDVDKSLYCDFNDEGMYDLIKHKVDYDLIDMYTDNIIITNKNNINLSFIVFNLSNLDLSCGG
eukprot:458574_1